MQMRATHRVNGCLAVEAAPEVFLIAGDDEPVMSGTLWKAECRIEEYDGGDTVEVSDEQLTEARENSTRWGPASREIRIEAMEMMQYHSGTDRDSPER